MNIVESTHAYERWLNQHTPLIPAELRRKHSAMTESQFSFMRATFYRWVQIWPEICRDWTRAPRVLVVGDLHVENFGTWRDIEGRLVWGINDFDEAASMPYANDLVRLATSALIAVEEEKLALDPRCSSQAIPTGRKEQALVGNGARWHARSSAVLAEDGCPKEVNQSTGGSQACVAATAARSQNTACVRASRRGTRESGTATLRGLGGLARRPHRPRG